MVYFLSDAHLGSRAIADEQAHQQTLIDMLNGMAKDATGRLDAVSPARRTTITEKSRARRECYSVVGSSSTTSYRANAWVVPLAPLMYLERSDIDHAELRVTAVRFFLATA